MKIRLDFVTNSSSSCFCVSLALEFDNGKKFTFYNHKAEGDGEYAFCENYRDDKLLPDLSNLASKFSNIAKCHDDINTLKLLLQDSCGICPSSLDGVTNLTDAKMKISACTRGEYGYVSDPFDMLGIENTDSLDYFTEKAREIIEKSQDHDGSKSFILQINKDGMIDVEFSEGEEYTPKTLGEDELKEIYNGYYMIDFESDDFENIKKSVLSWIKKNKYDIQIDQEDDAETFFSALGFDGVNDNGEEGIYLEGEIDESDVDYPLIDLFKILAPYTGGFGTYETDVGGGSIDVSYDNKLTIELDEP